MTYATCLFRQVFDFIRTEGKVQYLLQLDQYKAFDMVDHSYLWNILYCSGIPDSVVKADTAIKGFNMEGVRGPRLVALAHADDTYLWPRDGDDINRMRHHLRRYETFSGARINETKSKLLTLDGTATAIRTEFLHTSEPLISVDKIHDTQEEVRTKTTISDTTKTQDGVLNEDPQENEQDEIQEKI
ncbi:UNVERIFIED_CONTAM: hypothetical protein K2H54_038124 [Gekko kuhli]